MLIYLANVLTSGKNLDKNALQKLQYYFKTVSKAAVLNRS